MSDMESSQSDEDHMHIASKPSGIRRESDVIVLQGQLQDNDRGSQTFPRRVSSSISAPSNKSSSIHRRYIVTPSEGAQAQGSSTGSSTESLSDDTLGFERSQVALRSFTLKEKRPQKTIYRRSVPEPSLPTPPPPPSTVEIEPLPEADDFIIDIPEDITPGMHLTLTAEGAGTLHRSPEGQGSPERSQQSSSEGPPSTVGSHHSNSGESESDDDPLAVRPSTVGSHHSDNGESESDDELFGVNEENRGSFTLHRNTPEVEVEQNGGIAPTSSLHPGVKRRAVGALGRGLKLLDQREKYEREPKWSKYCSFGTCCSRLQPPATPPNVRFASAVGFKMMPNFFFPAVPKLLEDLWVFIELFITIFEVIFAAYTFENEPVNVFILVLTIINVILACLDSFLYFVQGGSCVACFRYARKKIAKRQGKSRGQDDVEDEEETHNRCQFITAGQKKFLDTWFQVIRTVLSELLLYPLAVGDLVELIESRTHNVNDTENKINFSLFNTGGFYLVLSVYFMRTFMAISAIVSVQRLPKTTPNNYVNIVTRFCVHLVLQNITHATILAMVGAKINSEVAQCANETEKVLNASPFLWYVMIAGDIIPLLGVIMFFVVNYALLKQFSVAFYLDIMSTVVSEGFAELVFEGEGIKAAKHKAEKVVKKSNLIATRTDFETYIKRFSWKRRILYRFTHPPVILISLFHTALVTVFLVCHALTEDPCTGEMKSLLADDAGVTATFFIGLVALCLANYQSFLLAITVLIIPAVFILLPVIAVAFTPILCIVAVFFAVCPPTSESESRASGHGSSISENEQSV